VLPESEQNQSSHALVETLVKDLDDLGWQALPKTLVFARSPPSQFRIEERS